MRLIGYRRTDYGYYALVEGRSLIYAPGVVFGGPRDPQILLRTVPKNALGSQALARLQAGEVESPAGDVVIVAVIRGICPLSRPRTLPGGGGMVLRTYLPELVRRSDVIEVARQAGLYSHHDALRLHALFHMGEKDA